jgi:hypothetical protein
VKHGNNRRGKTTSLSPYSCMGHITTPLTAAQAISLPPLQLHGHVVTCTTCPPPPPSAARWAMSPPSYSHTPCIAMHLAATWPYCHPLIAAHPMLLYAAAVHTILSLPSQPHRPHHHMPYSGMGHVTAPLTATYAASPHTLQLCSYIAGPSQLHRPHCHVLCTPCYHVPHSIQT